MEEKSMEYNFSMLISRIEDSFNLMDLKKIKKVLSQINDNSICIGTGGSNSVSHFASNVLEEKNKIISIAKEPRDILYMNLKNYRHILAATYSNSNYGVDCAMKKAKEFGLNCYTITTNPKSDNDICYKGTIKDERSFISIGSTILPMAVMLNYYLEYNSRDTIELVKSLYKEDTNFINFNTSIFEIMTGDRTYTAAKILESTIAEAGLGIPVIHEKYSYCHGRTTLPYTHNSNMLIYLINGKETELDKLLLENVGCLYHDIIILKSNEKDKIVGEFDLNLKSLLLCKNIAQSKNKDLSAVEYSDFVKKLYKYNNEM